MSQSTPVRGVVRWGAAAVLAGTFAILPGVAAGGNLTGITTAGQLTALAAEIAAGKGPASP